MRIRAIAVATGLLLCACSRHEAPGDGVVPITYPAGMTTVLGESQRGPDNVAHPDPINCGNETFQFATTVRQLPGGMRDVVAEHGSMADRDEDFEGSDAQRGGRPTRHFNGAAIGREHVFVSASEGGIVLITDVWGFERRGSTWVGNRRGSGSEAETLQGILAESCRQYAPRQHWKSAGVQLGCSVSQSGLLTIQYQAGTRSGDFEVRRVDTRKNEPVNEAIRDAESNRPASPTQLASLRETLQAARAAMHDEDECRFEVDAFLSAPGLGMAQPTP